MKTTAQILVVEDNIAMLRFLRSLLSPKYEVIGKRSAIDALKWLEEGNYPALIISDVMMSGIDNISFVKSLKISGFYRDTPIILLSSILDMEKPGGDLTIKVDAFFTKPFNPLKLQEKIGDLIMDKDYANTAA